jgi:hypothetical protein
MAIRGHSGGLQYTERFGGLQGSDSRYIDL